MVAASEYCSPALAEPFVRTLPNLVFAVLTKRILDADEQHSYSLGAPCHLSLPVPLPEVRCVFGTDEAGPLGIVATNGELYVLPGKPTTKPILLQRCTVRTRMGNGGSYNGKVDFLTVAGSGRAAATCTRRSEAAFSSLIFTSATLEDLVTSSEIVNSICNKASRYARPSQPKQLLANALAFTLLMHDGSVYTFGDPRYGSLGRQQDEGFDIPCRVAALESYKIQKIATRGFLTAALTGDGELFLWGVTRPGGPQLAFLTGNGPVTLQNIGGLVDETIVDVAVGDNHVVALTSDRRVFGIGERASREPGVVGQEKDTFINSWEQISTPEGSKVKGIACGRQCTFLLCDGSEHSQQLVPSGNAVHVISQQFNPDNAAVSGNGPVERYSTYEDGYGIDSDDSDLPMEGPEDWFRRAATWNS